MAAKKKNSDVSGSTLKKPRHGSDQSQGSQPQDTEPVEKFQDVGDPVMPECPIKDCEWKIGDMSCDEGANEVSSLLKKYYLHGLSCDMSLDQDGSNQFEYEYEYSKDYLQWFLIPPGFQKDWHISVQERSKKQLVAFIAAVPKNMRLHGKDMWMAEVKFLCVLDKPGPEELDHYSDHYSDELITTCQSWSRLLNLKKLFDLKFITLEEGMNLDTDEVEHNSLLTSPTTHGLRKMEAKDIPTLLQTYLGRLDVAPMFSENEVEHWITDGWTVTVASVGDSRCILDTQGGTVDHRLEENVEEREHVTASGGEVGRLNLCGGSEGGPTVIVYTLVSGNQGGILGKRDAEEGSFSRGEKKRRGSAGDKDESDDEGEDEGGDQDGNGGGGGEDPPDEPDAGIPGSFDIEKPIQNGNVWFTSDEARLLFRPALLNDGAQFEMTYCAENEDDRVYNPMSLNRGVGFDQRTGDKKFLISMDGQWQQFLDDMNIVDEQEYVLVSFWRVHDQLSFRITQRVNEDPAAADAGGADDAGGAA